MADAVCRAIAGTLTPPEDLVLTLTSDNGKEFPKHAIIAIACEANPSIAERYASWQRGTLKTHNEQMRYDLTQGSNFTLVGADELKKIRRKINSRPWTTLRKRTSCHVFEEAYKNHVVPVRR